MQKKKSGGKVNGVAEYRAIKAESTLRLRTAACITALREERGNTSRSSSDNETGQVGLDVVTKKIIHALVGNRFRPPF
jgi:hypothetical protein